MRQSKPFIAIISAGRKDFDFQTNHKQHAELERQLKASPFAFKYVVGYYKGFREDAFLVTLDHCENASFIQDLGKAFEQDCVFFSDEERNSWVINKEGERLNVGHFHSVSKDEALSKEYFTYDPGSKTYWITTL